MRRILAYAFDAAKGEALEIDQMETNMHTRWSAIDKMKNGRVRRIEHQVDVFFPIKTGYDTMKLYVSVILHLIVA